MLVSKVPKATSGMHSLRACPEMFGQIPGEQMIQVNRGARTFTYAVSSIGIRHEFERLPEFDEFIHQLLRALAKTVAAV